MTRETDYVTDNLQQSGNVIRYSSWPTIQQQTVGNHCWNVYRIHCDVFGWPNTDVAYYIMHHDSAELIVGDPPFPVKRDNVDLKAAYDRVEQTANQRLGVELPPLSGIEKTRVKVCDLLEMATFGMSERELGNLLATPIVRRTSEGALLLAKERLTLAAYDAVERYVKKLWLRHQSVLMQADLHVDYSYSSEISRLLRSVHG